MLFGPDRTVAAKGISSHLKAIDAARHEDIEPRGARPVGDFLHWVGSAGQHTAVELAALHTGKTPEIFDEMRLIEIATSETCRVIRQGVPSMPEAYRIEQPCYKFGELMRLRFLANHDQLALGA